MNDPFALSFSIGRIFGIAIRVHLLFPLILIPMGLGAAMSETVPAGTWKDVCVVAVLFAFITLLHEMGHCFGARLAGGEADEILLWPLGGLARSAFLPRTPSAHFIFTACGPLANLSICVVAWSLMLWIDSDVMPPFKPWQAPIFRFAEGAYMLPSWSGVAIATSSMAFMALHWTFYLSWLLFALNVALVGLPWDGGGMGRAILWRYFGYRQATVYMYTSGFVIAAGFMAAFFFAKEPIYVGLSIFGFLMCVQEMHLLEAKADELEFGYDFSEGYTSLEQDEPKRSTERKPGFIQRWLQARADRKLRYEEARQRADELRMDLLLEKIQREGKGSLSDEENLFLKRVSDRFRNRR